MPAKRRSALLTGFMEAWVRLSRLASSMFRSVVLQVKDPTHICVSQDDSAYVIDLTWTFPNAYDVYTRSVSYQHVNIGRKRRAL
ncbi:hypothetical protein BU23DRAFT_548333 [Bimuria novae-zelandiae CBS 107.79]|uniref:Uncharacterized protein n=1 Tax=Bimuria novae-zelandiae CBS 107.79 TaxID=1447943 RepID=A0A6A5VU87_9PLEO|nr:hypothetical protein BU23DRAFT_548333 [Bimuria novae-zelandiae CBS 107.79]